MGHLLDKQLVMAFLCLSMAVTIPATRKEDLERAAELAVERAAERAAERAVEKALEAGNTTSTTITVKESYSNARKTAEEQAAPGSESTRHDNKDTAFFESKDSDDPPDFESSLNETDYTDYNESRGYSDEESGEFGDVSDTKGFGDSGFMNNQEYHQPRGFEGDEKYDSKRLNDYGNSKGYEVEEDDSSLLNHTDYKKLNNTKALQDPEIALPLGDFDWSSNDSEFHRGFGSKLADRALSKDVGFYSTETDFLKKRSFIKEDLYENDENKDDNWRSYSEWKKNFEDIGDEPFSKDDEAFSKDEIFPKDGESFLKDESFNKGFWDGNDDDDDSPLKSSPLFLDNDEKAFFNETRQLDSTETTNKTNPNKEKDQSSDSTENSYQKPSSKDHDFSTFTRSWQPKDGKDSKSNSKSSSRKSSAMKSSGGVIPSYHKRLGRDNAQQKGSPPVENTSTFTVSPTDRTTERYLDQSDEYENRSYERSKVTSKERFSGEEQFSGESREDYSDKSYERSKESPKESPREESKEQYSEESRVDYKESSSERSKNRFSKKSKDQFPGETREEYKERPKEKYKVSSNQSREDNKYRSHEISNVKSNDGFSESYERPKKIFNERVNKKSNEEFLDEGRSDDRSKDRSKEISNERFSYQLKEKYSGGSYERYGDGSKEKSEAQFPDQSRKEYKLNSRGRFRKRPKESTTERSNTNYVLKNEEGNLSEDVRTKIPVPVKVYVSLPVPVPTAHWIKRSKPYKLDTPLFNMETTIPIDLKGTKQPCTTYEVQKKTSIPIPVTIPIPVQHQENSKEVQENDEKNLQVNYRENPESLQHVHFLRNLHESLNTPTEYPFIPRTTLKEANYHPHAATQHYSRQQRLPIKKHQKVVVDDRLPMLIKIGVPGPFPVQTEHLNSENPYSMPVQMHVNNPHTIHLDKSIPVALRERIPFIVHVPLKPNKNSGWSEARYSKKFENVPAESQTWLKRISWL